MDGLNSARWAELLAIMLASFLATSVPASAQDDEIQRQLIKLADEDFEEAVKERQSQLNTGSE